MLFHSPLGDGQSQTSSPLPKAAGIGRTVGCVKDVRQVFLGDNMPGLGVTVFGHTMTVWEDILIVAVIGIILVTLATWSFSRQE